MANPYVIRISWKNLLLVLGGGVALWLIPWLAWIGVGKIPLRPTPRKLPVYRYIRGTGTAAGTAWSPVLMPFPTSVGFSRKAAVSENVSSRPVELLKPKVSTPLYLELGAAALPTSSVSFMSSLLPHVFVAECNRQPGGGNHQNSVPMGLRVILSPELQGRHFTAPELPTLSDLTNECPPFAVVATVELDQRGFVQHLLLDQPSGVASLDARLIRALRAGTGSAGSGLASGLVKLYYWSPERVQ